MKKLIAYLKSLGWSKEDAKKILMLIIMLLITCFIFNKFLTIKINLAQERKPVLIYGSVNADVSGSIDTSGKVTVDKGRW